MKLRDYLHFERIQSKKFANQLEYSPVHIRNVINEKLIPSLRLAKLIEKATNGKVSIADLIPGYEEDKIAQ